MNAVRVQNTNHPMKNRVPPENADIVRVNRHEKNLRRNAVSGLKAHQLLTMNVTTKNGVHRRSLTIFAVENVKNPKKNLRYLNVLKNRVHQPNRQSLYSNPEIAVFPSENVNHPKIIKLFSLQFIHDIYNCIFCNILQNFSAFI